ncbi:energy transducer TonB [Tenacibaculum agarivorans]|uniref:energy transducer TonB n=1 Tax=Tenacibaculum agarivorans TaxID=1908389 RepID=UPI00094BA00C|nr:energy transducer TonB [Tenacibaculum agarivorans]
MKKLLYIVFLSLAANSFAQHQTCETKENTIEDLNSITKCIVKKIDKKDNKKTRQISVSVSASKKRFLKRRKKNAASNANDLNGAGISTVDNSTSISKSLKIKTNLSALTNRLTREELRSAQRFNDVDFIPAFPECGNENGNDQFECFNTEMMNHIQKHFEYPNEALLNKLEGKVWVRFIIDKEGYVTNVKALGPKGGKILNDEAIRVVSNLPRFTPAKNAGKEVSVKYGFPINFSLEDN